MRVVISRGFGAGWSTWAGDREVARLMLTFPPLIAALDGGGSVSAAINEMCEEIARRGLETPYLGGRDGLTVESVDGLFKVDEYDGAESIATPGDDDWWSTDQLEAA